MRIHIITIFPESFNSFFETSIIWNAVKKGLFEFELYKLNDFSELKTKRVDDKAYWWHWQVISPEPLWKAINFIFDKVWKTIPVIYMCPKWDLLTQKLVEGFYYNLKEKDFIIICGHYEWIDQRIIDEFVDYNVSIWEYILTSWELSSQVFIDSLIRHIPWVLWNEKCLEEDSFSKHFSRLKEYPVYTRPENYNSKKVPEVLLSWNHNEIALWKKNNLK